MEPLVTSLSSAHTPEDLEALVLGVLNRKRDNDNALLKNRTAAFGGLTKSFQDRDEDRFEKLDRQFAFLRAVTNGDMSTAAAISRKSIEAMKGSMSEAEYKTLTFNQESINASGGYTVPPEFAVDFARVLGQYGYARNAFRVWNMASNITNISDLASKPSVGWVSEGGAISDSKPTFGRLTLTAAKMAGIWAVTNEMLADTNLEVYNAILELFGEQFALTEDQTAFANTATTAGAQTFNGLLNYGVGGLNTATAVYRGGSSTSGKTGYPQIGDASAVKDAWTDWMYLIQSQNMAYQRGAAFYVDQNVWIAMLSAKDSNNRYLVDLVNSGVTLSTGFDGTPQWSFHGYPVVVLPTGVMLTYDAAAHVSTPFTIFGNLKAAWATMGVRGGFEITQSNSATINSINVFANDMQALRMTQRLSFGVALPQFISILHCSAS